MATFASSVHTTTAAAGGVAASRKSQTRNRVVVQASSRGGSGGDALELRRACDAAGDKSKTVTRKNDTHHHEQRTTRRDALFSGAAASLAAVAALGASPSPAFAEFQEQTEYMPSLEGKDYGKSSYSYPDFVQTESGIQARGAIHPIPFPKSGFRHARERAGVCVCVCTLSDASHRTIPQCTRRSFRHVYTLREDVM